MQRVGFLVSILASICSPASSADRKDQKVSAAQIGAINVNTKFDVKSLLRLFPKSEVRRTSCYPSDVLPITKDAVDLFKSENNFIHICSNHSGGIRLVSVMSADFVGYSELRVGMRWRKDVFKVDECRPEVHFFTNGTYNRVTCRRAAEPNVGYTFLTPPFNYGDGKPSRIVFEQGKLALIEWSPPER